MFNDDPYQQNPWMTDADPYAAPVAPTQTDPWASQPASADPATTAAPPPPTATPDYSTDLGPQSQTSAPAPTGTYDTHMQAVQTATDPQSQATAQDALARQVQSDLEADGHDLVWKDGQLIVDGRPYEIGGTNPWQTMDRSDDPSNPSEGTPTTPPAVPAAPAGAAAPTYNTTPMWQDPNSPPTPGDPYWADWIKANPDYRGQGYNGPTGPTGLTATQFVRQWQQTHNASEGIGPLAEALQAAGYTNASRFMYGANPSNNELTIDGQKFKVISGEDSGNPAWYLGGDDSGGRTGGAAGAGGGLPAGKTLADYGWLPNSPGYVPDFINSSADELPGYFDIYDTLMAKGALDDETAALVKNVLEHPESLSDNDVEMLKAKAAEEAGAAAQSQDEELQHYGYQTGLDSSPWLAGQRAQNAWNRRTSTIESNRNIDIAAAGQRGADRRSAAELGTQFVNLKASQKAQAVQTAVSAALGKAGEQRSRKQLNESLKQAATQLGLSKDQLVMTYLNHAMDDITRNKGLDLNFDIDMKKLAAQSDEFKQTLLQRIHEQQTADDQFRANYGLAVQTFQQRKDQDAWERAKSTYGL